MSNNEQTVPQCGDLWGHPKGLYVLFFTEMWERFCYYGMRSILVYYMMKQLMFAQDKASYIYGLYTSASYFVPFFGGIIADRYLGQRKSAVIGAITMAIGEFVLMVPEFFFAGLTLIAIGTGFFKPNLTTQVGGLYHQGDHRRDRAFNLYYMGINAGALISPLICGYLGERYGWKWGFMAAGIGLIIGALFYFWGLKFLAPDRITKRAKEHATANEPLTRDDYIKMAALGVLCLLNIVFWGAYEQQGNTLAVWVDSSVDRMIFGWLMPASWFQAFNPIMVIVFIPLISWYWGWLDRRGKESSSIGKMASACFMLGISFLVLVPAVREFNRAGTSSLWWMVVSTWILTIGEIYLSPIGLSLVTKLSPAKLISTLMGIWFASQAGGQYFCGWIGTFYEKMGQEKFFTMIAAICFAAGFCMLVMLKPLKHAIGHGRDETADV